jgi:hypothetical protein
LLVLSSRVYKWSINPISNPKPPSIATHRHPHTLPDSMFREKLQARAGEF